MEARGHVVTAGWDADGAATVVASGADERAALEAGLRGILQLAAPSLAPATGDHLALPLQGTGGDLAGLFRDLVEDLCARLLESDTAISEVALDGILRRNEEGYRGWGYLFAGSRPATHERVALALDDVSIAEDAAAGIVLRATLRRS